MCCGCVQPGLGMDREYLINGIDDMEVQVNELWKYPAQLHSGIDDKEVLVNELWKCPAQLCAVESMTRRSRCGCGCVQPSLGMDIEYLINGIGDKEENGKVKELWMCPAQGWHGMDDREVQVNELWIHPAQLRDEPRVT